LLQAPDPVTAPRHVRVRLSVVRDFEAAFAWVDPFPLLSATRKGAGAMKELITRIAQALVDNPDQVLVSEIEGNQTTVLELKVAKEDLGKVIGKEGRNARAMRTILGAASAKLKKRTVLEILE
jgi:predicted RNA-binding protein YlqC (UPF0109 family)